MGRSSYLPAGTDAESASDVAPRRAPFSRRVGQLDRSRGGTPRRLKRFYGVAENFSIRDRGRRRVECEARLSDGLCGYYRGFQTTLEKVGPLLPERDSRAREPDQRESRDLDLAKTQAASRAFNRSGGGRDLHRPLCLSRAAALSEGCGGTLPLAESFIWD